MKFLLATARGDQGWLNHGQVETIDLFICSCMCMIAMTEKNLMFRTIRVLGKIRVGWSVLLCYDFCRLSCFFDIVSFRSQLFFSGVSPHANAYHWGTWCIRQPKQTRLSIRSYFNVSATTYIDWMAGMRAVPAGQVETQVFQHAPICFNQPRLTSSPVLLLCLANVSSRVL